MSRKSRLKAQKRKKARTRSQRSFGPPFHLVNAELPIYGTWELDVDLEEEGMTTVIIARSLPSRDVVFGTFLIDVWGVGLKDCYGNFNVSPRAFEQNVLDRHPELSYRPCDLAYAQSLIWGSVEHSKEHGFKLPKEFRDWSKIVGQPPADAPPIEFGKDGELFVIGKASDIARRIGTSQKKAMNRISEKGHFLLDVPEELVTIDEEELIDVLEQ